MRRKARIAGLVCALTAALGMAAEKGEAARIQTVIIPTVKADVLAAGRSFRLGPGGGSPPAELSALLHFDLVPIPQGAHLTGAVLRLTPADAVQGDYLVGIRNGRLPPDAPLVGQIRVGPDDTGGVESLGNGLAGLAERAAGQSLDLRLADVSSNLGPQDYVADGAANPAEQPRLILTWDDGTTGSVDRVGAQLRYAGDPPDATPWRYDSPSTATVTVLQRFAQIATDPVFRGDEVVLIATPPGGVPAVQGMALGGAPRWTTPLPRGVNWTYLLPDPAGRLLAFRTDGSLSVLDGFAPAPQEHTISPLDLKAVVRPAIDAGGVLTLRDERGALRAFSPVPGLRELWRVTVGAALAPRLSPRGGDGLVYTMTPDEAAGAPPGLVAVDAARGTLLYRGGEAGLTRQSAFHPPLIVAGPEHDWVYPSGFGGGTGRLMGYADFTQGAPAVAWKQAVDGPVSRCVAPPALAADGGALFCVQSGRLRRFRRTDGRADCASESGLSATSGLVADGTGQVYFWDENAGVFNGFDANCKWLFRARLSGLPALPDGSDALELRAGPDGAFYLRSHTELFAITPAATSLPNALQANTRYNAIGDARFSASMPSQGGPVSVAATGRLSFDRMWIERGVDLSCSGATIAFGRGVAVDAGGVLRCSIAAR